MKANRQSGASFRLEENEANRHVRMEGLSQQIGEGSGSAGGFHQEQLASGEWIGWAENSFETLLMEGKMRSLILILVCISGIIILAVEKTDRSV
ncbi:MAG: hypothetical protein K2I96_20145 [Lachnospiraceae bacterium]|nr:hypothetical protein [Lachnospiraceae bacterium]